MLKGTVVRIENHSPDLVVGYIRADDDSGEAEVRFYLTDVVPPEMRLLIAKGTEVEYCPNGVADGVSNVDWVLVGLLEPGDPEVPVPDGRVKAILPVYYETKGVGFFLIENRWVEVPNIEVSEGLGPGGGKLVKGVEISCLVEQRANGTLVARDVWIVATPAQVRIRRKRRR